MLTPVTGCFVKISNNNELGQVLDRRAGRETDEGKVGWRDGRETWHRADAVESGLQHGWRVQDVPVSTTRRTLGPGQVVATRTIGGREQHLVQLEESGHSVWLPFENLRRLKDLRRRYVRAETDCADHLERCRLRMLAHALENWNDMTGSLDRLDVDPLPHQIQLVHRIVSSGQYNWLIADDVGLGKTIEVGLLLAALKRKGLARRVLIVAPAGLVRQWQDEMKAKFDQDYLVYGRDFLVNDPEHWKLYDHVVVSIDLAKRDVHMDAFRQSGGWDVVIFDEGHKLTRYPSGERVQRYRLAEMLRPMTPSFLLLSGTPHQGYPERFKAILELIRPDLKTQIQSLEANPEVVGDMVLRNRKSEVTDSEGYYIFQGQKIHRVPVTPSSATEAFQKKLNRYLRQGYGVADARDGRARAIGFVMTTYRKLASSSIAAIERALHRRLDRLRGSANGVEADPESLEADRDLTEGGDDQDSLDELVASTSAREFFEHETEMLLEVLDAAAYVRPDDEKLRVFLEDVVQPLVADGKRLLVFTEYRATQEYLVEHLRARFGWYGEIRVIHGGMSLQEKIDSIQAFNDTATFLVSTEAGGEGINLHRACHVMVNYDLPWNPARLVQRIGRLYRYGQPYPVIVFNLHARDSFDNAAIDLMMQRVMQIANDMAPVGDEFGERLYADILGDILDRVDMADVMQAAYRQAEATTREQVDEAVDRAQRARQLQEELFAHVGSYDPNALAGTLGLSMAHVRSFVEGMAEKLDCRIEGRSHGGRVTQLRLPEQLHGHFADFGRREVVRITADRHLPTRAADIVLVDFETPFFQYLVEEAKKPTFGGHYAIAEDIELPDGAIVAFKLRWQNDQGIPTTEEFLPLVMNKRGEIRFDTETVAAFLLNGADAGERSSGDRRQRQNVYNTILERASKRLADESGRFKHPNAIVELAALDTHPGA